MTAKFYPIDRYWNSSSLIGRDAALKIVTGLGDETVALTTSRGTVLDHESWLPFSGLETSVFTIQSNRTDLISEMTLTVFMQNPLAPAPCYYMLDKPRLNQDDVEIEFYIELGEEVEADGSSEAVWALVGLHGTVTIPAKGW